MFKGIRAVNNIIEFKHKNKQIKKAKKHFSRTLLVMIVILYVAVFSAFFFTEV
jgi:hypothetical protein